MVGLAHLADRHPAQLSGIQQQRVALAWTIVVRPGILLLDGPLSNPDANLRVQMRDDIRKLQRKLGLTTIFVTHDQEEANTISNRMSVLDMGVIQQVGSPMDLYDYPVNRFVSHFLGTTNFVEGELIRKNGDSVLQIGSGIEIPIDTTSEAGSGAVVFRPQSVHINPYYEVVGADELSGTVAVKEFLGSTICYSIAVGKDTFLVEEYHQRGKSVYAEDEKVCLVIQKDQILFVES